MRKPSLYLVLLFTLIAAACRGENLAPTPAPPSASLPEPNSGASLTSLILTGTSYSQNIRFEHFSLEEGLSQSVVTAILQDRLGFLWVGTEDGLNRYDGYGFKVYKPDPGDPASLSDRWITSLAEDSNGYLWVGTRFGGLNRYDPISGKFARFMHDADNPESLGDNRVSALLPEEGGMWIGTDNGVDYYTPDSGKFSHIRYSAADRNTLSSNSITALFRDSYGILWIGTSNAGVNTLDTSTNAFHTYRYSELNPTSLSHNRVLSIAEGPDGEIWVGTAYGLNRFERAGQYFTRYLNSKEDPDSLSGNTVHAVYQDLSGGLWLGTSQGLDRYDPLSGEFIHHRHQPTVKNSLSHSTVYKIYEDLNGVIWIGTYGGGLNKYNRQQDQFTYYRHNPDDPNSLSGDFVFPILVDAEGIVWIGVNSGGLNRFDPKTGLFKHYRHDPFNSASLSSDDLIALEMDRQGILWIGSNRGLDRFNPKSGIFTHFQLDESTASNYSEISIFTIHEDARDNLWIGTTRGLYLFDRAQGAFIDYNADKTKGTLGETVTAVLDDAAGDLWIGTFDNGLQRMSLTSGEIIRYKNDLDDPSSLGNDSILCLYQDTQGNLWVGTTGGGLNLYLPGTDSFKRFTQKDGLPNDVIYGILEDRLGNLWLSTNFGLSRFDPLRNTFRNYTASDGLQSNEFDQNAFAKDRAGNLYFGGINGMNVFSPANIMDNPLPPSVVLTSISQDGNALNLDQTAESLQEITLAWPQDSFEFEFAALAYAQPAKNQYSYILENFDSNWIATGNKRNGRYTNLPGGSYTLRLRGSNSDGTWNNAGASIKVTVIPPVWERWWFQSLILLLVAVSIAGGLRWRVKSIEGRNRELERLVQKRTADLEKRSREIEALYQADEKILRNVTLIQVYQTLVDVSVSLLKADRSVVFAWNDEHSRILPRVSQGFRPETLKTFVFEEGEGFVGHAMQSSDPVIVQDLRPGDLRGDIQTVIRAEGIQSFALFPIEVDGKVIAVFNVGYTRPNALNEDTIRLFTALVQRASLSIANMQLFEQTKDLAVMEERNRLARDLHDSAKQKAFAALAQLGTANGMYKARSDGIQPHLSEAENLVYEVIQELTFLIQEIYPIALQDKGLLITLREYIYEWENRNDAVVNLTVRDDHPLPLDTEQAIYRVIQEALANVSRHSRATRVDVSLIYDHDTLQVTIADNGCGFDIDQKAKGMGFRSMRERIGSIRGSLHIQSKPEQGTRVIVQIPIKIPTGVDKA